MTPPVLPEGRYGSARRRPRWAGAALLVVGFAVGIAVAVVAYRNLGSAPIDGQRLAFTLLDDSSVEIRFEVSRDDPARAGVCLVRARSLDGEETGRREVYVPPGADRVVLTTVVRTSRPPVTGDVYGCSLRVPPYLEPTGRPRSGG